MTDRIMLRIYSFVFPVLIAVLGWMLIDKVSSMDAGIREVGSTLENIRADISDLNQRSLLLEQKVKHRLELMQKQLDDLEK